jgi:hypothetical protein
MAIGPLHDSWAIRGAVSYDPAGLEREVLTCVFAWALQASNLRLRLVRALQVTL